MKEITNQLLYDMKEQYNDVLYDEDLKWISPENNKECLRNWIKYKLYIKKYPYVFDSDASNITKQIIFNSFKNVDITMPELNNCSDRTFIINLDKTYYLDTDTLSSMATMFNAFMKSPVIKNIVGNIDIYDISKKRNILILNYDKLLKNFDLVYDKIINSENKEISDIFNLFVLYSKVQHTIGNFILIPKDKNVSRYSSTRDDLEASIEYFKSDIDYNNLFNLLDNELSVFSFLHLKDYAKSYDDYLGYPNYKVNILEFKNYLTNIINLILIRGLNILKLSNDIDECEKLINEIKNNGYKSILKDN